MALYFIENFYGATPATLIARGEWDMLPNEYAPGISTNTSITRNGLPQVATFSSGLPTSIRKYLGKITAPGNTVTVGLAVWFNSVPVGNKRVLMLREGNTTHVSLGLDSNDQIAAWRGDLTTLLVATGVSGRVSNPLRYYQYLEIEVFVSDTVGTLKIWVNNTQIANLSSIDTQNGGVGFIDNVVISQCGTNANTYITDIYALDQTGTFNNSRLGDCRVDLLLPSADNDVSWTKGSGGRLDNYTYVDDAQVDGDTTYVLSTTAGQRDIYEFQNLPSVCDLNVRATSTFHVVRNEGPSANSINSLTKIGSTVYSSANNSITFPLSSDVSYDTTSAVYLQQTNPATGVQWTKDDVNSAAFGIERV